MAINLLTFLQRFLQRFFPRSLFHWVPTITHIIIHYNCEHFITRIKKPQSSLRSAVVFRDSRFIMLSLRTMMYLPSQDVLFIGSWIAALWKHAISIFPESASWNSAKARNPPEKLTVNAASVDLWRTIPSSCTGIRTFIPFRWTALSVDRVLPKS